MVAVPWGLLVVVLMASPASSGRTTTTVTNQDPAPAGFIAKRPTDPWTWFELDGLLPCPAPTTPLTLGLARQTWRITDCRRASVPWGRVRSLESR
jgi:hypothetical protein